MIVIGGEALVDLVEERDGLLRPIAGGGPFNTAIALGRLDVAVAFLGTLSDDGYGELLAGLLVDAGVDTSLVRRSSAPTPLAVVHHDGNGKNAYTFYLEATSLADLPARTLPELPKRAWAVHVGTLSLAVDPPASTYEALVEREAGRRTIILDPNARPSIFGNATTYRERFERLARLSDVVKLSDDDARWIYPELELDAVVELIRGLGPRLVAVTLGAGGALAASAEAIVRVPAQPVAVVDTVGAGDSFGAALLAALLDRGSLGTSAPRALDEETLRDTLRYASAAAAITCTRRGSVPPRRAEIDALLASR